MKLDIRFPIKPPKSLSNKAPNGKCFKSLMYSPHRPQTVNDIQAPQKLKVWTYGPSYKHFMLINYDSRVVPDWKIPHITTLES